jgi:hypothetical protein
MGANIVSGISALLAAPLGTKTMNKKNKKIKIIYTHLQTHKQINNK